MFLRKGIRGAILRTNVGTRHICEAIAAESFPSLVVGDRFESSSVNFVYSDSRDSSREAVDHLIALGHRQIAISFNNIDDADHADRLAGYRAALKSHDIPFDEKLVFQASAWRGGGVQLIRRLCGSSQPRPTAIYIADPLTAASAVGEAQELGLRIPDDLSIVGFDDADLRFLARPHLTAVCQDAAAIGRQAAKALHDLIERPGTSGVVRVTLPTAFEIHDSTAPPPAPSSRPAPPDVLRPTLQNRAKG
jgi:DNA-binding LacI/PurR family transcriptional regulator